MDVVRIGSTLAGNALAALRERGIRRGPALANLPRCCVEVVVPRGTAATWPALRHTWCIEAAVMRCPSPAVTSSSGLYPVDGRLWLTPPTAGTPAKTDADELAEAVTVALVRRAMRWIEFEDQPNPRGGQL